jgi:RNA polymerase sigma-70 factor, ECF subfamily
VSSIVRVEGAIAVSKWASCCLVDQAVRQLGPGRRSGQPNDSRQIGYRRASYGYGMPPNELAAVYDLHAAALFHFLRGLGLNEAETRDVLQEVFYKLAQPNKVLDGAKDPRAFLIRMARNLAVDGVRRRETRTRYHHLATETGIFQAFQYPDEEAFRLAVEKALTELPEDQRMVIHLKLWQGMTFDAVACALDIPLHTAASRYRYGLDKLRVLLRPLYSEIQ